MFEIKLEGTNTEIYSKVRASDITDARTILAERLNKAFPNKKYVAQLLL